MIRPGAIGVGIAMILQLAAAPALAWDYPVVRYGNTSGWYYDDRDDHRDFPVNTYFPGNFAADPSRAWIGAKGLFGSNPERSAMPYPSQVTMMPTGGQNDCARRHRSYDPVSGTYRGKDGLRHRC